VANFTYYLIKELYGVYKQAYHIHSMHHLWKMHKHKTKISY